MEAAISSTMQHPVRASTQLPVRVRLQLLARCATSVLMRVLLPLPALLPGCVSTEHCADVHIHDQAGQRQQPRAAGLDGVSSRACALSRACLAGALLVVLARSLTCCRRRCCRRAYKRRLSATPGSPPADEHGSAAFASDTPASHVHSYEVNIGEHSSVTPALADLVWCSAGKQQQTHASHKFAATGRCPARRRAAAPASPHCAMRTHQCSSTATGAACATRWTPAASSRRAAASTTGQWSTRRRTSPRQCCTCTATRCALVGAARPSLVHSRASRACAKQLAAHVHIHACRRCRVQRLFCVTRST